MASSTPTTSEQESGNVQKQTRPKGGGSVPRSIGEVAAELNNLANATQQTASSPQSQLDKVVRTMEEHSAPVVNMDYITANILLPNQALHVGATMAFGITTIIAELLSLGQVDKLLEPLIFMYDLLDSESIFRGLRQIRLQNNVFTPFLYRVNEMNPVNIPPYSDLIRMRIRENMQNEPIISQEEFEQQMKYLGFSEFWSKGLWDAHFMLPSNQELFLMRQYGIIDVEELRKMLIINDRHPSWVDQLIDISLRYPSQRELRMMARRLPMPTELIDKALQSQGLRPEYHEYYKQMFEDWDIESIDGRRQTQMVGAFADGILSEEELRAMLPDTNASPNEIDKLVKEADIRRYRRRLEERRKTILNLYQKYLITREDAEGALARAGYEAVDIDHWLDYAYAKMGEVPEIEEPEEDSLTELETPIQSTIKFEEWNEIEHPLLYPIKGPIRENPAEPDEPAEE